MRRSAAVVKRTASMGILLLGAVWAWAEPPKPPSRPGAVAADGNPPEVSPRPWTARPVLDNRDQCQFAIVADRTGGARPGIFEAAVERLNLLRPGFVVCVGDLVEGYGKDEPNLVKQWQAFDGLVDRLAMRFYYVPGNHDLSNALGRRVWLERHGPTYYHFQHRDVLFLCLDSEEVGGENGGIASDGEQLAYFRQVLAEQRSASWTVVFLHKPLWETPDPGWLALEAALAGRQYIVFAGHRHQYARTIRQDRRYIRLATTGGMDVVKGPPVGREVSILAGRFDAVTWVTMTPDGPVIANLMLDGIWPENVTTVEMARTAELLKRLWEQLPARAAGAPPGASPVPADNR